MQKPVSRPTASLWSVEEGVTIPLSVVMMALRHLGKPPLLLNFTPETLAALGVCETLVCF